MAETGLEFTRKMEGELAALTDEIHAFEDSSRRVHAGLRMRTEDVLNDLRLKRATLARNIARLKGAPGSWEDFRQPTETSCQELRSAVERSRDWFR